MCHPADFVARADHAFGEEEPDGQLAVCSGRPHGDRQRLPLGADLERFLGDDVVGGGRLQHAFRHSPDFPLRDALHSSFSPRFPSSSTTALN